MSFESKLKKNFSRRICTCFPAHTSEMEGIMIERDGERGGGGAEGADGGVSAISVGPSATPLPAPSAD